MHVSALLRDEKGKVPPSFPLTFKIFRSDEVLVKSITLMGNELGFYNLELPLSTSSREGLWSVHAYADTNKEPIGSVHFSIEDFVPSRMFVRCKTQIKMHSQPKIPRMLKYRELIYLDLLRLGLKGKLM